MSNVIQLNKYRQDKINVSALRANTTRRLAEGLIAPPTETVEQELAPEHAAEPIKSMDDIDRIAEHLLHHKRYRDYMLFIVGINLGLRASDLRELRFSNLINEDLTFKQSFAVFEHKTRNTRAKKCNRYLAINDAIIEAVTLYLENTPGVCLSDYLFKNTSSNAPAENKPLTVRSIERTLKNIAKEVGLDIHVSTHTLRKTFCYHQMLMSHNDPRKLLLLQKMLGHSSVAQTLAYIGITDEEMHDAYMNLNLGSRQHNYLTASYIYEAAAV